jgi:sialate O-acetylesterase
MMKITIIVAGAIAVLGSLIFPASVHADITVDKMFSDHMVLQRGKSVPVWGIADPGEKVSVSFGGQKKETTADPKGHWTVKLDPLKVGKPGKLTVVGKTSAEFSDVLVGEVWVGSGQSNMDRVVGRYIKKDEVLARLVKAAPYRNLRLYRGGWKTATEDNIPGFSALMFSFGQSLQKELDVPVGLIVGAVGGTPSGRWLNAGMFLSDPGVKARMEKTAAGAALLKQVKSQSGAMSKWESDVKQARAKGELPPKRPEGLLPIGDLYAGHIASIVPYAIGGILWDQGEHHVGHAVRHFQHDPEP